MLVVTVFLYDGYHNANLYTDVEHDLVSNYYKGTLVGMVNGEKFDKSNIKDCRFVVPSRGFLIIDEDATDLVSKLETIETNYFFKYVILGHLNKNKDIVKFVEKTNDNDQVTLKSKSVLETDKLRKQIRKINNFG